MPKQTPDIVALMPIISLVCKEILVITAAWAWVKLRCNRGRVTDGAGEVYAETQYPEVAGCSSLRALVDQRWKFIGGPAQPELYDLSQDPAESRDVAAQLGGAARVDLERLRGEVGAVGAAGGRQQLVEKCDFHGSFPLAIMDTVRLVEPLPPVRTGLT